MPATVPGSRLKSFGVSEEATVVEPDAVVPVRGEVADGAADAAGHQGRRHDRGDQGAAAALAPGRGCAGAPGRRLGPSSTSAASVGGEHRRGRRPAGAALCAGAGSCAAYAAAPGRPGWRAAARWRRVRGGLREAGRGATARRRLSVDGRPRPDGRSEAGARPPGLRRPAGPGGGGRGRCSRCRRRGRRDGRDRGALVLGAHSLSPRFPLGLGDGSRSARAGLRRVLGGVPGTGVGLRDTIVRQGSRHRSPHCADASAQLFPPHVRPL